MNFFFNLFYIISYKLQVEWEIHWRIMETATTQEAASISDKAGNRRKSIFIFSPAENWADYIQQLSQGHAGGLQCSQEVNKMTSPSLELLLQGSTTNIKWFDKTILSGQFSKNLMLCHFSLDFMHRTCGSDVQHLVEILEFTHCHRFF